MQALRSREQRREWGKREERGEEEPAYKANTVHVILTTVSVYFQLSIPIEKLPDTHLRIGFRHVTKNEGTYNNDIHSDPM